MNDANNKHKLLQRIEALSRPLAPEPTGMTESWLPIEGIRAVLFDVYGTLFISGVGDISIGNAESDEQVARDALTAAGWHGNRLSEEIKVTRLFEEAIRKTHDRLRSAGIQYPEVDVLAIWKEVLEQLPRSVVAGGITEAGLHTLAVDYEFHVNPVWPMPGLKQTLTALHRQGLVLGLVSNAQFYTPMMFQALLGETLPALGFELSCCAFSYRMGEAKPSTRIFQQALDKLAGKNGIKPSQTLYVGNDMLKDIWPAQRLGCRTVLFAGDRRSLRLRQDDERCAGVKPDCVITDLRWFENLRTG
jgi:putative hydrolase of the HAD superfamily